MATVNLPGGAAINTGQIDGGSAVESYAFSVLDGGTLSFDWFFRTGETSAGDNDFAIWSLYRVENPTFLGGIEGGPLTGGTYQFVDAGTIIDSRTMYLNAVPGSGAFTDPNEVIAGDRATGWEFGIPYNPDGTLAWNNLNADIKADQEVLYFKNETPPFNETDFNAQGDVDTNDGAFFINVGSDGNALDGTSDYYVIRFGVFDYNNTAIADKTSQLNIDRVRIQEEVTFSTEGNVITGEPIAGGGAADTLSVDGTRVHQVGYDRNGDGVIAGDGTDPDTGEVYDVPHGGSVSINTTVEDPANPGMFLELGTLTIESDGDYFYQGSPTTGASLKQAFPGVTVFDESFAYTLVDGDGDTSAAQLTVRIDATSGDRSGDEVTLVFIRDRVASLAQPVRRLRAFARTSLAAGQTELLTFELGWKDLGFWDNEGRYVVEPGEFEVHIGGGLEKNAYTVVRLT